MFVTLPPKLLLNLMTQFVLSVLADAENTCAFVDASTASVGTESLVVKQPEGSDPTKLTFTIARNSKSMWEFMLLKPEQALSGVAQVIDLKEITRIGVCVGAKMEGRKWLLHHEMGHVSQVLAVGAKRHFHNVAHRRAHLEADADEHAFKAMSSGSDCHEFNKELLRIRLTGGLAYLAGSLGSEDYGSDLTRVARCLRHPKGA